MRLGDYSMSAGLDVTVEVCESCLRTGGRIHSTVFKAKGMQRRQTGCMRSESHQGNSEDDFAKWLPDLRYGIGAGSGESRAPVVNSLNISRLPSIFSGSPRLGEKGGNSKADSFLLPRVVLTSILTRLSLHFPPFSTIPTPRFISNFIILVLKVIQRLPISSESYSNIPVWPLGPSPPAPGYLSPPTQFSSLLCSSNSRFLPLPFSLYFLGSFHLAPDCHRWIPLNHSGLSLKVTFPKRPPPPTPACGHSI